MSCGLCRNAPQRKNVCDHAYASGMNVLVDSHIYSRMKPGLPLAPVHIRCKCGLSDHDKGWKLLIRVCKATAFHYSILTPLFITQSNTFHQTL